MPHEAAIIIEARLAARDGDYRWFDITARDFRHDDEVGGLVITARDVTEERAAKIGLRKSERWFRGLVQNSSDVIAVIDDDGVFTYASPAVDRLLGYRPDELRGRSVLEIISEEQIRRLEGLRRELARDRVDSRIIEVELARRDGDLRVVEVTLTDLRDDPSVAGMVLNIRDVTDRKQLEQDLRHQVLHDDLTGLGSRVQFSENLFTALGPERRTGSSVAVLFIDLDDFKNVNDSLGHVAGDQVLVEISSRLLGRLRLHDRAARFGGDEFAVLLTDVYSESDVTLVADRIVEELGQPITLMGREVHLSVSVGIAIDEDSSQTPEDLLRSADVAMYQAKEAGKGRWAIFQDGMADKTMERFEISNALAAAIENDELMVYFQPIVELHNARIAGLEALVRWAHPARGMVSPASFIPIAERNGLILPLGRSVLRAATTQVAKWRERGHAVYVSVNISAVQLASEGIVEEVLGIVDESGIERSAVVLELTESALIADFALVVSRINTLRAAGLRVAIDDFGTGYSTLTYASEFAADILKIDQSFVAKLEVDEHSSIVSTVLSLARAMGAETVAEGIETPGQHAALLKLGCELGQGYYFTKPLPADQIERALEGEMDGHTLVGR
jgi:diguanylate cyclase (GGDEF)-like protein/PAS domain S-box-containing protein